VFPSDARGLDCEEHEASTILVMQAVGNVGYKSRRGRHTTRAAVLLEMPDGGFLLDTPGFNYPAMDQVSSQNVADHFPEITAFTSKAKCQFDNCSHTHEPGCSIRHSWERYEYYIRCANAPAPGSSNIVPCEVSKCLQVASIATFPTNLGSFIVSRGQHAPKCNKGKAIVIPAVRWSDLLLWCLFRFVCCKHRTL
jgi:hypothetical protein